MGSTVLSALYHSIGFPLRNLRWVIEVGHLCKSTENEFPPLSSDSPRLEGFSQLRKLILDAASDPDEILFCDQDGEYSKSEEISRTLRLAEFLKTECGVTPNSRVAIMMKPQRQMFEAFWAAQAIGAIPVPINFKNERMTIAYTFSDSGADTLIVGGNGDKRFINGAKRLANFGYLRNVISTDNDIDPRFYNYEPLVAPYRPGLHDLTYALSPYAKAPAVILYTSGTESAPRGVVYPYENIAYHTDVVSRRHPFTKEDVMLFCTPFYHLSGLISSIGGTKDCKVVISPIPIYDDPGSIETTLKFIKKYGVSIFPCSPLIAEPVLELALEKKELLPNLRLIFSGGSLISKNLFRLVDEFNERRRESGLSPVILDTMYASTEFGPISSTDGGLSHTSSNGDSRFCLGKPFENVELRLDPNNVLYARTKYQVSQYLNHPELPMQDKDGFIRVGDIVDVLGTNGDQKIYFVGRDSSESYNDPRGYRISPVKAREELDAMKSLDDACVFAVMDRDAGGHILCALVIPRKGETISSHEIDSYLQSQEMTRKNRPSIYFIEDRRPLECINGSSKMSPRLCEKIYGKVVTEIISRNPDIIRRGRVEGRVNLLTNHLISVS